MRIRGVRMWLGLAEGSEADDPGLGEVTDLFGLRLGDCEPFDEAPEPWEEVFGVGLEAGSDIKRHRLVALFGKRLDLDQSPDEDEAIGQDGVEDALGHSGEAPEGSAYDGQAWANEEGRGDLPPVMLTATDVDRAANGTNPTQGHQDQASNECHQRAQAALSVCWGSLAGVGMAGRGTSCGHCRSPGQLTENQSITASYLRAVKEAPSRSRSKKRQSPVDSRATVDASRPVALANSEAQVSRW